MYLKKNKKQNVRLNHMSTPKCHFIISGQMLINIVDVNDNAPEFIYSDSVFGEFMPRSALDCSYHWLLRV